MIGITALVHMFVQAGGCQSERVFPGTASSPASVSRGLGQQTGHSEATFLNPVCRWTPVVVLNPVLGNREREHRAELDECITVRAL